MAGRIKGRAGGNPLDIILTGWRLNWLKPNKETS
jgi:hypothetical protein